MTTLQTADYVSLSQMTLSEATDHNYTLTLSGYQLKLLLWCLFYVQRVETGVPQLDYPKSNWKNIRQDVIRQVDRLGATVDPDPCSQNHLTVMNEIREQDAFDP